MFGHQNGLSVDRLSSSCEHSPVILPKGSSCHKYRTTSKRRISRTMANYPSLRRKSTQVNTHLPLGMFSAHAWWYDSKDKGIQGTFWSSYEALWSPQVWFWSVNNKRQAMLPLFINYFSMDYLDIEICSTQKRSPQMLIGEFIKFFQNLECYRPANLQAMPTWANWKYEFQEISWEKDVVNKKWVNAHGKF